MNRKVWAIRIRKLINALYYAGLTIKIVAAVCTVLMIFMYAYFGFFHIPSSNSVPMNDDDKIRQTPISEAQTLSNQRTTITPSPSGTEIESTQPAPQLPSTQQPSATDVLNKNVVFIYHSHNRESWIPELGVKHPEEAFDPKKNITLVGKRLADKLEALNIHVVHTDVDYPSVVPKFKYPLSYLYSNKTVKDVFLANPNLQFIFDIHRDSGPRDDTTVTLNGKTYSQIFFIIGRKNPNWQQNEAFALSIHKKIETKHPGLSRGIWDKSSHNGNGEYNQSISPHSILIEIGGPYNNLEESYRTADILAQVVADMIWQAQKANAPSNSNGDTKS